MAGKVRIALAAAVIALAGCGWTQYGGNAAHTGQNPFETALTTANVAQATELWQAQPSALAGPAVIANNTVYAASDGFLRAWPARPIGCTGTPPSCAPAWFAFTADGATSTPVVLGDVVYIATAGSSAWHLYAYDALGRGDCSSKPVSGCLPRWSATWGSRSGAAVPPLVTVGDGRVFVQTANLDTHFSEVTAFDAAGAAGCAGTPRVCAPQFRTMQFVQPVPSPPTVENGRLYVPTATAIAVFDTAGVVACTTGTCNARFWLGSSAAGGVAVADGTAYAIAYDRLSAFNAGCADGSFCNPVWNATLSAWGNGDAPIIAGDLVFTNSRSSSGAGAIEAFDRSAGSSCTGVPLMCPRRFAIATGATFDHAHASASANLLIVTSGTTPSPPSEVRYELSFFDLAGSVGCSGVPRSCQALATLPLGSDPSGFDQVTQPALASGLVVVPYLSRSPQVVGLP
jgi:hypothetical protein